MLSAFSKLKRPSLHGFSRSSLKPNIKLYMFVAWVQKLGMDGQHDSERTPAVRGINTYLHQTWFSQLRPRSYQLFLKWDLATVYVSSLSLKH
jgi:hypothetical protein